MNSLKKSPITIVAEAVARAENGLVDLPLSPDVRDLHRRVSAVKTVLFGIVRAIPTLSVKQREGLAATAVALADEVAARRMRTSEPVSGVLPVDALMPVVGNG